MRKITKCAVGISIVLVLMTLPPGVFAGHVSVGGWSITTDSYGAATSLSIANPKTYLGIEALIDITVDYQGTPVRGTVKFTDGVQRDLNAPEEVTFYWDEYKGAHALWEYLASVNKVALFNPDNAEIPTSMYGRFTRVISKDGVEYFGTMAADQSNPDWFYIQNGGHNMIMYRHVIAVIQQMKS